MCNYHLEDLHCNSNKDVWAICPWGEKVQYQSLGSQKSLQNMLCWSFILSTFLLAPALRMTWFFNMLLLSFDWSNKTSPVDVKIVGSVLEEKPSLRCWGWHSLLNWIGALILSLLLKLPLWKLEPWLVLWSFFLLS